MSEANENEVKHTTIYAALAAAQRDMGPVLKENMNPAFKSRYADLSNVVGACLPALNKHGIAVFQPMREIDGKRFVVTILAHESGETIENPVELIIGKNDMQGLGSAMTYARRYGLMAMAGVAPEDDDGNAAVVAAPKQQTRQQPVQRPAESRKITPEEFQEMKLWLEKTGSNEESFMGWLKADDLHTISIEQWNAGMTALKKKPVIKEEDQ